MYKYILMDNDGTLMDFQRAQAKAIELAWNECKSIGDVPYSEHLGEIYDRVNDSWWKKLERAECTKNELMVGRFRDFLKEAGVNGDENEMAKLYEVNLSRQKFLMPGAVEKMKELSGKYRVFIVTNGIAFVQHGRLDDCEFTPYFEKMYVSEETGFAKPDKRYFDYVLADIGDSDLTSYLVVGDSLSSDIKGAMNAGIDAVWVNPDEKPLPCGMKVKCQIKSISDLEL